MDDYVELAQWERELLGLDRDRSVRVDLDLSIRRVQERIDRALDVGNEQVFVWLCELLKQYQAQDSRAPGTP